MQERYWSFYDADTDAKRRPVQHTKHYHRSVAAQGTGGFIESHRWTVIVTLAVLRGWCDGRLDDYPLGLQSSMKIQRKDREEGENAIL